MTLRGWSITWALLLALSLTACPDDESTTGTTDTDIEADGAGDAPDGTESDGDTGGGDAQGDTGQVDDAGNDGSIELVALTEAGTRGLGVDLFALTQFDEPAAFLASPGYQMNFEARTDGVPKASPVTLSIDGVDLGTASVDSDVAGFPEVALAPGVHQITARVTVGGRVLEDVNTVTVGIGSCDVTLTPSTATCLQTDADPGTPGFQVTFTVTNPNKKCKLAYLEVSGPAGTTQSAPVQLGETGVATITASLSADDAPLDSAVAEVTAIVMWPGADELTAAKVSTYHFDTQAPAPTITSPSKPVLTQADDEGDIGTPGISITVKGDVVGLTPDEIDSLELTVDGAPAGTASPSPNKKFQFKNVVFTASGTYTLVVKGTDTCGLSGSSEAIEVEVELGGTPPAPTVDLIAATALGAKGAGAPTIALTAADEPAAYTATPGFQMDLEAVTTNVPTGTTVTANVAGALFQAQTDAAGVATFAGVNLTKGDQTVSVSVSTGGQTAQVSKTVSVDINTCDVIVEPAGGCLTDDASVAPGQQASIVVKNPDGQCDTATVVVTAAGGQSSELTAPLEGGQATFLITAAAAGTDDEAVTVTALVEASGDPALAAQTNPIAFLADSQPPTVAITAPATTTIPAAADADGDPANGVQIDLAGTVAGNHGADAPMPLTVMIDGAAQADAVQVGAAWTTQITVAGAGTYSVTVDTSDTCGLTAGAAIVLTVVDGVAPSIDVLAATANGPVGEGADTISLAAADEPASWVGTPGYQMDFTALTTNVPEGTTVTLTIGGADFEATTDASGFALFGGVTLSKGSHGLTAFVSVDGLDATIVKTLIIDLPACDIELTPLPAGCLTEDGAGDDGFQATFQVTNPDGTCDTASLTVVDTTGASQTVSAALAAGTATFTVTLAPATPVDGLIATITAQVESSGDAGLLAKTNDIAYTVDDTAPAPTLSAPVESTIPPSADLDGEPGNGVQIAVAGTAAGASDVEILVDGASQVTAELAGASFTATATLTGLGAHTIMARATDACGLQGTTEVIVTVADLPAPTIDLVAATANGPIGEGVNAITLGVGDEPAAYTGTPGYQMDFSVLTTNVPEGTTVTLSVGGASFEAQVDGFGEALFGGVILSKGIQAVGATVTVGAQVASVDKAITVDIPACDIVLAPATPSCLTEDASADAGFQAVFVVSNPDGQCDVAALVVTRTDGSKVTQPAVLIDGQATFTATLATGAANGETALVAAAVDSTVDPDLGAQTNEIAFPVDATAPTPTIGAPSGDISTAADIDGNPDNGVQVAVTGDASSSAQVDLAVDGAPAGAATLNAGAFSGTVTLSGLGQHTITATATDACGLTGTAEITFNLLADVQPTIDLIASGANGPVGAGEELISLVAADEPATWLDAPGFQMDFTILTTDVPEGTSITLTVGGAVFETAAGAAGITVVGGVNLTKGSQAVEASVTVAGKIATVAKTLLLDIPACDVTIEPGAPMCLTEDASGDAGFQASFIVSNPDGQCDVAGLVVTNTDGAKTTLTATLVGGQATFMATLAAGAADGGTAKVAAAVDSTLDSGLAAQTNEISFTVDDTAPQVAISIPAAATVLTTADLDGVAANGVQLTIGGTSAGAATVELSIDGTSQGVKTPEVDSTWSYEVTFAGAGAYALDVQATDGCGLVTSDQRTLGIEEPPIEVVVISPLGGSTLFAKNDGDAESQLVYETTFTATVDRPAEGGTLQFQCTNGDTPGLFTTIGGVTLTQTDIDDAVANAFDVPVSVDTQSIGSTNVLCRAVYLETDSWQSAPVSVVVALPAPTLVITSPTDGSAATSTDLTVTVFAEHLDGVTPTVILADDTGTPVGDPIAPGAITAGALTFTLSMTQGGSPLPDADYTLFMDAPDGFGNLASEQLGNTTLVTFTLDTTAPSVALTAPKVLLQPQIVAEDADQDGAKPGYQTTITATVSSDEPIETIEVCLTVGAGSPACVNPAPGATEVSFTSITLVPGDNAITVTATDPLGNVGTALQTTKLELDAPLVTITTPASGVFVTDLTIDVVATVTATNGTPITGATVDLLLGGTSAGLAAVESPNGTYTFTAVPLAEGPNDIQVTATAAAQSGASAAITVNRKSTTPSIGITLPTDLQTLNVASTVCQTGVKACILDVQATVANVADDVETTLTVNCGTAQAFTSVVASGASTWPGITLPDQTNCTLKASVTDKAGQFAESAQIAVSVDRVAPVLNSFPKPSGDVLQPTADEDPTVPGMQKKVQVSVTGVQQGQQISVKVFPDGVDPSTVAPTLFGTVPSNVSDLVKLTVDTGTFSITTSGYWTLQADVMDKAGNPASSLSRTIYVNVNAPLISVVSPTNVDPISCTVNANCGAAGICNAGKCAVPWSKNSTRTMLLQLTGIALGANNVRLCTNNPGNVGGPCATPGFTVAKVGDVTSNSVSLSAAALIDGLHRIVAEAEPFPGDGQWVSSLTTAGTGLRERTIFIDTIEPVITNITCTSDTLPPTLVLNQAEQVSPGTFNFSIATTDNGVAYSGKADVYSNAGFKTAMTVTSGTATGGVNFVVDGVKKIQAVVTDNVGNKSVVITNPAAFAVSYTVKVDPLTLEFSAPTKSPLIAGDSRSVSLSSNQTSGTVKILDGGVEVASKAISGDGTVAFDHATYGILADGTHTLTAVLTDSANNTQTVATQPATIEVDTVPPTLTLTSPVTGVLTDADDAAPTTGGYQVAVDFSTGGAATWKIQVQSGCNSGFTGCSAPVDVASGAITNPGGAEPGKLATLPILAADTWHKISVEVRDALGNKTTQTANVQVTLTACVLSFTNLPVDGYYNASDCAAPGCSSIAASLNVQFVGPCNGVDMLTLYKDGVPIGQATELGTQEASFPITLTDGDAFTIWAELTSGGGLVAETGNFDVVVDLTNPTVAFTAATVLGFATPATGATVTWGMTADQTPGSTATIEVHLRTTVTGAGVDGQIVSLTATGGGGPVALATSETPVSVTGSPFVHDFKFVSIPDQDVYTVTVTVADAAGNQASASFQATVDISPPEEVVIEPIDALLDVVPRLPAITLKWQPPASNTGIAGGAAASYEIRYSTEPISTEADWTDACLASALPFVAAPPTPGDPAGVTMDTYMVRGPDPRSINTNVACKFAVQPDAKGWYFAVRAKDAAGNQSPVTGGGAAFTDAATLNYAKITHTVVPPQGTPQRMEDKVWAIGDINGDGYDDLAVGGYEMSGFCIVYGHDGAGNPLADVALAATSGTNYQCIFDATPTALGVPVVRTGDVNGDGLRDLAVGAGIKVGASLYPEEVRVYLGVTGGGQIVPTPVLTIKGTSNNALYGIKNVASAGNFNGDVHGTTGLPLEDLIIPSGIGNKVYVVPGSASFIPGSSTTITLTNAADRATWNVVTVSMLGAAGNAYFGWAVEGGGNILTDVGPTQYDDVVIAMAKDPAQVVVVKGRPATGDTTIPLSNLNTGAQTGDATAVRLFPDAGVGTNSFGADLGTRKDLDGKGTPDIVVNHQYASATVGRFYTFFGEKLTGKEGQTVYVSATGAVSVDGAQAGPNGVLYQKQQNFTWPLGDFDGSLFGEPSTEDLAYSVYSFTSYGKVTVRLNHAGGATGVVQGLLPFEDVIIRDPYTEPPSDKFGITWAPIGDFNGDGLPDLLVGTNGMGWAVIVY